MAKVILLSQFPLPHAGIGSWTVMYKNYLTADHLVDWIVCAEPQQRFTGIDYQIVENGIVIKLRRRLLNYYRINYVDALEKLIMKDKNQMYVIQLVDNFLIVTYIIKMLRRTNMRQNCYIQIFYHGFPPFIKEEHYDNFHANIDELVLLTNDSYKVHKDYYSALPCKISVLYNGVDTTKFKIVSADKRIELKAKYGFSEKKVFMFCAKDRPKKGLSLILDVWKRIYESDDSIVLLVVGAKRDQIHNGVKFIGEIPNDSLPEYYQMSDCYLFPTLCQEGFGLSLIEALNCGCYCIASNYGGVPEVLQYGKYGRLIENPNFYHEWEAAIINYLNGTEQPIHLQTQLYPHTNWNTNMNQIIDDAKRSLD